MDGTKLDGKGLQLVMQVREWCAAIWWQGGTTGDASTWMMCSNMMARGYNWWCKYVNDVQQYDGKGVQLVMQVREWCAAIWWQGGTTGDASTWMMCSNMMARGYNWWCKYVNDVQQYDGKGLQLVMQVREWCAAIWWQGGTTGDASTWMMCSNMMARGYNWWCKYVIDVQQYDGKGVQLVMQVRDWCAAIWWQGGTTGDASTWMMCSNMMARGYNWWCKYVNDVQQYDGKGVQLVMQVREWCAAIWWQGGTTGDASTWTMCSNMMERGYNWWCKYVNDVQQYDGKGVQLVMQVREWCAAIWWQGGTTGDASTWVMCSNMMARGYNWWYDSSGGRKRVSHPLYYYYDKRKELPTPSVIVIVEWRSCPLLVSLLW